jgi:hypothetical protein
MWYEILINGYSWFTNQSSYTPNIKLASQVGGELTEGHYTQNEAKQIREQLHDIQLLGYNKRLIHLNRTGLFVEATLSKCCNTSVSSINGSTNAIDLLKGANPSHHYICNKCKKETQINKIPYWELTTNNKYRELNLVV